MTTAQQRPRRPTGDGRAGRVSKSLLGRCNSKSCRGLMVTIPRFGGTLAFLMSWLVPWHPIFRVRSARSDLAFFVHRRDAIGRHIAKYGTHEPLLTKWP